MCQRIGRLLTGPSLRTYRLVSRYNTGIEAKARTRPTRRPGLQVSRPGRRCVELLRSERDRLLLHDEYGSRAMRDPSVRGRYVERQARLRAAIGNALATRMEHLGAETDPMAADVIATAVMALGAGLARERLMEPDAVPDEL